jgi:hypothetical protein
MRKPTGSISLLGIVILVIISPAGCGKPAPEQTVTPEQTMIGQWQVDRELTKKTNPLVAAPGLVWHEFKADGSYLKKTWCWRRGPRI